MRQGAVTCAFEGHVLITLTQLLHHSRVHGHNADAAALCTCGWLSCSGGAGCRALNALPRSSAPRTRCLCSAGCCTCVETSKVGLCFPTMCCSASGAQCQAGSRGGEFGRLTTACASARAAVTRKQNQKQILLLVLECNLRKAEHCIQIRRDACEAFLSTPSGHAPTSSSNPARASLRLRWLDVAVALTCGGQSAARAVGAQRNA